MNLTKKDRFHFKTYKDGEWDTVTDIGDSSYHITYDLTGRPYMGGPAIDRLHEFEKLGYEPEQIKRLIEKDRVHKAWSLAVNSVYGRLGIPRCDGKSWTHLCQLFDKYYEYCGDRPLGLGVPGINRVIFNNPATIVFWSDGTKTVVKCQNGDPYDPEKGLAMAISKKALGNNREYYHIFKHWMKKCESHEPVEVNPKVRIAAWYGYHRIINALHDKKATKADLIAAMEEAVSYLGEELE